MGAARAYDFTKSHEAQSEEIKKAPPKGLEQATVFVSRTTVRSVMIRELKNYGIQEIKATDTIEDCCRDLKDRPNSMLVVDWEHGEQKVARVLTAAQGAYRVDTRPIYFIALEMAERVISFAREFNVTQIHTGEISQAQIVKNLNEIVHFSLVSPACRKAFHDVAMFRKKADWASASRLLEGLCRNEPNNLRAAVEYGYNLCEEGRIDDAEQWLLEVSLRFPGDLRTRHLLARCSMKRGKFEEAHKLLEEAGLISPYNVDRLVDLGTILLRIDKTDEALGKFQEALKLDKELEDAKLGQAQCEMLKGHINDAVRLLGSMQEPKELASVFNNAAIIAIHNGHFKQGLQLYKSAVSFVQKDSQVLARVFFNMGVGLVKWGKAVPALAAFERAVEQDPKLNKAQHNREVLQAIVRKGGSLTAVSERMEELEDLGGEDLEIGSTVPGGKDAMLTVETKDGAGVEEVDDSYFQSLLSKN